MKKVLGKNAPDDPRYSRVNLITGECIQAEREFALMSRRPGIGSEWFDKYQSDAFPSDFLISDGKKHPVPRFYNKKLKEVNPVMHKSITKNRVRARELDKENTTTDRLRVRHEVKKSKLNQLKRSL